MVPGDLATVYFHCIVLIGGDGSNTGVKFLQAGMILACPPVATLLQDANFCINKDDSYTFMTAKS